MQAADRKRMGAARFSLASAVTLTGRFSHAFSMPAISFCRSKRSRLPSFFTTM